MISFFVRKKFHIKFNNNNNNHREKDFIINKCKCFHLEQYVDHIDEKSSLVMVLKSVRP